MLPFFGQQHLSGSTHRCINSFIRRKGVSKHLTPTSILFQECGPNFVRHGSTAKYKSRQQVQRSRASRNNLPNGTAFNSSNQTDHDLMPLLQFRYSAEAGDAPSVIEQYSELLRRGIALGSRDSVAIFQAFHRKLREHAPISTSDGYFLGFVRAVDEYQKGILLPNPRAIVHILGAFRDSGEYEGAIAFWNWATNAQQEYLSLPAYGVAINVLCQSGHSLESCEDLYSRGLQMVKGDFNDYLLSPGSVLSQPNSRVQARGVSMNLLQAIIEARLQHGDWIRAYQGLDTALKLFPDGVPGGLLAAFDRHRPLVETIEVFRMLCRSGNLVPAGRLLHLTFSYLADRLSSEGRSSSSTKKDSLLLLRVLRCALASGFRLNESHLSLTLKALKVMLPLGLKSNASEKARPNDHAFQMFSHVLKIFQNISVYPSFRDWRTLGSIATTTRDEMLAGKAIMELLKLGYKLDAVTVARILNFIPSETESNGKDYDWNKIVQEAGVKRSGKRSQDRNWELAMEAAIRESDPHLFCVLLHEHEKLTPQELVSVSELFRKVLLTETQIDSIDHQVEEPPALVSWKESENQKSRLWRALISNLKDTMVALENGTPQTFTSDVGKPFSLGSYEARYPDNWFADLYYDLHVKPLISTGDEQTKASFADESQSGLPPGAILKTGFNLAEIRFQNWRDMTALMLKAQAFADSRADLPVLTPRPSGQNHEKVIAQQVGEQVKAYELGIKAQKSALADEQGWRANVMKLRGGYTLVS